MLRPAFARWPIHDPQSIHSKGVGYDDQNSDQVRSMNLMDRRKLEVFFAFLTTGFGIWLLFPSAAMGSPGQMEALELMSESAWGWLFLSNGLMHVSWLAVNEKRSVSPILRFWAAFGAGCLYLLWCFSIAAYDPISTGVFTYGALSAGSWACCIFAWRDALTAVRVNRAVAKP